MTFSKKILAASIATATMAVGFSMPAQAEVSASASIASAYAWRGFQLGSGTPVVSGDLVYSESGFTAGIWGSSGDTAGGSEYDVWLGYEYSTDDFFVGGTVISYIYPTGSFKDTEGPGDFMEFILSVGYGPISFNYHDNIAGETGGYAFSEDYTYMNISAAFGDWTVALGKHDEGDVASVTGNSVHLDVSYAYNENLSFLWSAIVDSEDYFEDTAPEPSFVVSYSLPLGE